MQDFVTLSCPSCGAKLQINNTLQGFACSFCGNEHVVIREGGVVSLSPVVEQIRSVQIGIDKTASELALVRLRDEIRIIEDAKQRVKKAQDYYKVSIGNQNTVMELVMNEFIEKYDRKPRASFLGIWKEKFSHSECADRWTSLTVDELAVALELLKTRRVNHLKLYNYDDTILKSMQEEWESLILDKTKILELPKILEMVEKHKKIIEE